MLQLKDCTHQPKNYFKQPMQATKSCLNNKKIIITMTMEDRLLFLKLVVCKIIMQLKNRKLNKIMQNISHQTNKLLEVN